MAAFLVIQTLFWLALSTWFGGVLFIALAAPVVFRTVREANPTLPTVLSVNLEGEHGSLLAGSIVGSLLQMLSNVQVGCAVTVGFTIVGQWLTMDRGWALIITGAVRSALFVAAVVLVVYDRRILYPRALAARQEYIDHADEPEIANPAKEQFDRYHRESVRVLFLILLVLSLIVCLSANIYRY